MPGKHSENTKLLGFFADLELVAEIDKKLGGRARSQFLRDAVIEYLMSRKVTGLEEYRSAPSRLGKGGPAKYPAHQEPAVALNDASSKAIDRAKAAARLGARRARKKKVESPGGA